MAKKKSDAEAVQEFMSALDHPFKTELELLRQIIQTSGPNLQERVKWNSPSFHHNGVDLSAFNLRQTGFLQLILLFPKELIPDPQGIMLGSWKDRREVRFGSVKEVEEKREALGEIVRGWLEGR
ncbi:MAG: DUF1801 domain-containing protein [Bacteroidota bacterium]